MLGRKKKMIPKKYVVVMIIILIILILIIFSFTLKGDRKLNPVESFLKDGLVYTEKVVTYPFNYISNKISEYKSEIDKNEKSLNLLIKIMLY